MVKIFAMLSMMAREQVAHSLHDKCWHNYGGWCSHRACGGLLVSGLLCQVDGSWHWWALQGFLSGLWPLYACPVRMETKLRVFEIMAEPVMFYGCDTWPITLRSEQMLTSYCFSLIPQIVNCRWHYVRWTDELMDLAHRRELGGDTFQRRTYWARQRAFVGLSCDEGCESTHQIWK